MNYLIWRLHRNQVYFASAALVAVTVLLLVTGNVMAHDYNSFLATCGSSSGPGCGSLDLFRGDGAIMDFVDLTVVVPLLFGLFWGAPLLAKEFEDGTHNLAWTQGVTRKTWLRVNLFWVFVAAALWGGVLALLLSWWRYPENAIYGRFAAFDIQGIAPIVYALFAVALGIAVGSVFKRVLPALATTIGLFVAIRVVIELYVRPHLITPITKLFLVGSSVNTPAGAWVLSGNVVGPNGQSLGLGLGLNQIPAACIGATGPAGPGLGVKAVLGKCLGQHGFHMLATYQPDSRFWAFQGIEAAIFVALAVGLVLFARWWVLSRDA